MTNYIIVRLVSTIPTILMLMLFVVFLIRLLPGNVADIVLAETGGREGEIGRAEIERELGLDKPFVVSYLDYVGHALQGDLGSSLWTREKATSLLRPAIIVSFELGILAIITGVSIGIPLGVLSAAATARVWDYVLRSVAILGLTVPNFAIATMLIVFPVIWFDWSPPLRYTPLSDGVTSHVAQFITPGLILGFGLSAGLMRLTRTTMLEVLRQDYVRTARAKGLRYRVVVMRHAVRNALIPVVSIIGLQVGLLVSGTVILESIFGLPGMGRTLINAINTRDYPIVQAITLFAGLFIVTVNLVVDLSYGYIDPRVRVGQ